MFVLCVIEDCSCRVEDERGFRPPWEDRGDTYGGRGPADGYATRGLDEDRWVPRGGQGAPPPPQRPYGRPPPGRFGSQDRFGDFPPFADDAALFPPPPPPSRQPPPPPRTDASGDHANGGNSAEVDPEREAFLAELDRVAQDLEKVRITGVVEVFFVPRFCWFFLAVLTLNAAFIFSCVCNVVHCMLTCWASGSAHPLLFGFWQERQRKLEQEVVVVEEEPVPKVAEPAPPVKEPSGPLTLAQVAAANVTEVDEPAEVAVSFSGSAFCSL